MGTVEKEKERVGKRKWRGMKQMYGWPTVRRCSAVYATRVWPLSRGEPEIIRSFYIVSRSHAGTSVDLSHSMPWKESKYFSSRMYSVFIKQ